MLSRTKAILAYILVGYNTAFFMRRGRKGVFDFVVVAAFWPLSLVIWCIGSVLGTVADRQKRHGPFNGNDS